MKTMTESQATDTLSSAAPIIDGDELLSFYTTNQDGQLKMQDVFRMWERAAPRWWEQVTGMKRADYWDRIHHRIVARYARVSTFSGGRQAGETIATRLVTKSGLRPRRDGGLEAGAVDCFHALDAQGQLLAEVVQAWTWLDMSAGKPAVAQRTPAGLQCRQHELPSVEDMPTVAADAPRLTFRWTLRETDPNRHVTFLSYVERAENAVAELQLPASPSVWEGWYRRECHAGELMTAALGQDAQGRIVVELSSVEDGQRRAILRGSPTPSNWLDERLPAIADGDAAR